MPQDNNPETKWQRVDITKANVHGNSEQVYAHNKQRSISNQCQLPVFQFITKKPSITFCNIAGQVDIDSRLKFSFSVCMLKKVDHRRTGFFFFLNFLMVQSFQQIGLSLPSEKSLFLGRKNLRTRAVQYQLCLRQLPAVERDWVGANMFAVCLSFQGDDSEFRSLKLQPPTAVFWTLKYLNPDAVIN